MAQTHPYIWGFSWSIFVSLYRSIRTHQFLKFCPPASSLLSGCPTKSSFTERNFRVLRPPIGAPIQTTSALHHSLVAALGTTAAILPCTVISWSLHGSPIDEGLALPWKEDWLAPVYPARDISISEFIGLLEEALENHLVQ